MQWHTMQVSEVLRNLETSEKGIESEEADLRLKEYGPNKISSEKRRTILMIFLEQFKSFLVGLLLFAMLLSFFLGMYLDAAAIGLIVLMNSFLGFYQEHKAEKAIEELKKLIVSKTTVMRDGEHAEISTDRLVPGDIVLLEEGSRVPADMRLIEVINLKVDESMLTGESEPIVKDTDALKDVELPERKNMVFTGTLVSYGRGRAVVTSTGMTTEMGKIAGMVEQEEEETPLQAKLQNFSRTLGVFVIIVAVAVFLIGLATSEDLFTMFLTSMSLAIAAVPEGLPAVITLTLAVGTQKMLKKNSAIKRLSAVETLGSVTVICADKTGTMTTNEMTVRKIWFPNRTIDVTGVGFEPSGEFLLKGKRIAIDKQLELLLRIADDCNDSVLKKEGEWRIIGDPTEGALKVLARKANLKVEDNRCKEIPFSSERKIMTTIHDCGKGDIAYSKGAPEKILKNCKVRNEGEIMNAVHKFASEGLRVLAFSYKDLGKKYKMESVERDMKFVGLVAMIDPPRKETKEAIRLCRQAGIRVKMITGDHKLTAQSIAEEIGLRGKCLTGEELNVISDEDLDRVVDDVTVFARVSPQDKMRIVESLRRKGNIIAMTGDGVNDAPALKRSDIGIAIGMKGTDVAREAADMILLDDNFSTIVHAIREGRRIYDNIKKFVRFLLSANFGEVFIVAGAMAFGILSGYPLPIPFLPLQILWINLITDGVPALSLGFEPAERDIMKKKPRNPKESILHSSLLFILFTGFLMFIVTLCIFVWELYSGLSSGLPMSVVEQKARTMAFTTVIFFQMLFVLNCRFEKKSVFSESVFSNKRLIASILFSLALQVLVVYLPMAQAALGTVSLDAIDWLKVLAFSSLGLFVFPEILMRKTFASIDYAK
jgi:P-type Ca2+ transporter type 2C